MAGTTNSQLGPPTPIIKQKKCHRLCLQANVMQVFSPLRLPFLKYTYVGVELKKTNQHNSTQQPLLAIHATQESGKSFPMWTPFVNFVYYVNLVQVENFVNLQGRKVARPLPEEIQHPGPYPRLHNCHTYHKGQFQPFNCTLPMLCYFRLKV